LVLRARDPIGPEAHDLARPALDQAMRRALAQKETAEQVLVRMRAGPRRGVHRDPPRSGPDDWRERRTRPHPGQRAEVTLASTTSVYDMTRDRGDRPKTIRVSSDGCPWGSTRFRSKRR